MRNSLCRTAIAAALALGSLLPLAADEPPVAPVTLEYAPAANQVDQRYLRVDIKDILITDASTGMTGSATAEVKLTVTTVTADTATLRGEISKLSQRMAGHALPSTPPKPMVLQADRRARLLQAPAQESQAPGEILSQGGLPIQALTVICCLPQLPDKPVAPGDTWQRQDTYDMPGLGKTSLAITTTFLGMQQGVAMLRSTIRVSVPDFQADNPLLPGQQITIHNLVVEATDLLQQYDPERSAVLQAAGNLKASLEANGPDMTMPVKLVAAVNYRPLGP